MKVFNSDVQKNSLGELSVCIKVIEWGIWGMSRIQIFIDSLSGFDFDMNYHPATKLVLICWKIKHTSSFTN